MAIVTTGTSPRLPVIHRPGVVPRYCHGCGCRMTDGTMNRWCSTSCFLADEGPPREDDDGYDYDEDEES